MLVFLCKYQMLVSLKEKFIENKNNDFNSLTQK